MAVSTERTAAIIGNGGHGRDVREIMDAARWICAGYFDDDPAKAMFKPELAVEAGMPVVIAINDPKQRFAVWDRLRGRYPDTAFSAMAMLHPNAIFGQPVQVGRGSVFGALSIMTTGVHVGYHTHLNVAASISQGSRVGNFCTIGPGARVCGDVLIGDRVFIGAGAVISNLAHVNDDAVVGAGAVVLPGQTVARGATVVGVPAKEIVR